MKVSFSHTPRGNIENIHLIQSSIIKLGYQILGGCIKKKDLTNYYNVTDGVWARRYKDRLIKIGKADVSIFEVSTHSISTGQLLQESLRQEKPVIALYTDQEPQFLIGTAIEEKRLQLLKYNAQDILEVLRYGFEVVEDLLNTRFTMILPAELVKYLDFVNKTKGISKSEFIRELISENKVKDKCYKNI